MEIETASPSRSNGWPFSSSPLSPMGDRDFVLRAAQGEKFRPATAEKIMMEVMTETLAGETFSITTIEELSNDIAATVNDRLKAMQLPRYKYVVQVMIGENRGQGMHSIAQCVWDADADAMAAATHHQNNLWCQTTAFAVFTY